MCPHNHRLSRCSCPRGSAELGHVLNQLALERQGKGEKERVYLRTVKAFTQVLASGYDDQFFIGGVF